MQLHQGRIVRLAVFVLADQDVADVAWFESPRDVLVASRLRRDQDGKVTALPTVRWPGNTVEIARRKRCDSQNHNDVACRDSSHTNKQDRENDWSDGIVAAELEEDAIGFDINGRPYTRAFVF